jgi:hypothetical protein
MRHALDLFRFEGRVTRRQYLAAGAALFAIKYSVDHLISHAFHHPWNPLMYLSPRVSPLLRFSDDKVYWIALLVWALPFMWAGVSLTARRLRRELSISGRFVEAGALKRNDTHPLIRLSEPQQVRSAATAGWTKALEHRCVSVG